MLAIRTCLQKSSGPAQARPRLGHRLAEDVAGCRRDRLEPGHPEPTWGVLSGILNRASNGALYGLL